MTDPVSSLTAILVTPDARSTLASATSDAAKAQAMADWPCDGPEDEATLVTFLGAVQERIRSLEEVRKTIADPLTKAKRALDGLFSAAAQPYEAAKEAIKAKLEAAEGARQWARLQALAVVAEDPTGDQATQARLVLADTSGRAGGASFRYEWEWTLEDITQVPAEFLALNRPAMVAYASRFRSSETIEGIPGVGWKRVAKAVAR